MTADDRPTPQDYADLFEIDKRGERILEDLIQRFSGPKGRSFGIDRILDTHERVGRMQILDFICSQINRSHGINVQEEEQ